MSSSYEKYRDMKMNQGINTDDAEINIGINQSPDCDNVRLKKRGGIASMKGKESLGTAIPTYTTLRGATLFVAGSAVYAVTAQDDGSETKIYARNISSGVATELTESGGSNTLPTNTRVRFAQVDDFLVWIATGTPSIYSWEGDLSNPVEFFLSIDGNLPINPKLIIQWKNRLWFGNTEFDSSEAIASAYRDYHYFDTDENSIGDAAWYGYPDSNKDEKMVAILGNAFDTMFCMRTNSAYVLLGTSEDDWGFEPITLSESAISNETVVSGSNAVYYLGVNGIHVLKGMTEVSDVNAFGSIEGTVISQDVEDDMIKNYTLTEKKNAFAIYHNNKYRLNVGGDVYIFDLAANTENGALYKASVESDIGRYLSYNEQLYGVGKEDGKLYLLETGNSNNGVAYDKYYSTKELDCGYPDNEKDLDYVKVFGKVEGDYNIYCDYFLDGNDVADGTLTLDFRNTTDTAYYPVTISTSTSVGLDFLTDTTQAWDVNALAGLTLVDDDYNSFTIISNTDDTLTVEGTPIAGTYVVSHSDEAYYTLAADSEEVWATFYSAVEIFTQSEDKTVVRGRTIKLKFYNNNVDEPFEIFGFQIKFEALLETSLDDET